MFQSSEYFIPQGTRRRPSANKVLRDVYHGTMAVRARKRRKESSQEVQKRADKLLETMPSLREPAYEKKTEHGWTPIQEAAARLYAAGLKRERVAKVLLDLMVPKGSRNMRTKKIMGRQDRLRRARNRCRAWEMEQWFRDRVYELVTKNIDLEIPGIMDGVVKQAKKGRVDAAKFSMEIAGRYSPKGDESVGNVTVVFGGGLPRPQRGGIPDGDIAIEGEVIDEE